MKFDDIPSGLLLCALLYRSFNKATECTGVGCMPADMIALLQKAKHHANPAEKQKWHSRRILSQCTTS